MSHVLQESGVTLAFININKTTAFEVSVEVRVNVFTVCLLF